jgi:outer membrane cobalamin receptor
MSLFIFTFLSLGLAGAPWLAQALTLEVRPLPFVRPVSGKTEVTQEDMKISQPSSFSNLLDKIPALTSLPQGGPGALTPLYSRGGAAGKAGVILDGIRVNDGGAGEVYDFGLLPPQGLEKVQWVTGVASLIEGQGADLIIVDTMPSQPFSSSKEGAGWIPSGRFQGGSFHHHKEEVGLAHGGLNFYGKGRVWQQSDCRLVGLKQVQPHGFEQQGGAVAGAFAPCPGAQVRVSSRLSHSHLKTAEMGVSSLLAPFSDYHLRTEDRLAGISMTQEPIRGEWHHDMRLNIHEVGRGYGLGEEPFSHTLSHRGAVKYVATRRLAPHHVLKVVGDGVRETWKTQGIACKSFSSGGGALTHQVQITPTWRVEGGIRVNTHPLWKIGLGGGLESTHQLTEAWGVTVGYTHTYQAPTLSETYGFSGLVHENKRLSPMTIDLVSGGARWLLFPGRSSSPVVSGSLYEGWHHREIVLGYEGRALKYMNTHKSCKVLGGTGEISLPLTKERGIRLTYGATTAGSFLPLIPKKRGGVDLYYNSSLMRGTLGIQGVGPRWDRLYSQGGKEVTLRGYGMVRLAGDYEIAPHWRVNLTLENGLNRSYQTMAGWGSIPRSIYVGMTYEGESSCLS